MKAVTPAISKAIIELQALPTLSKFISVAYLSESFNVWDIWLADFVNGVGPVNNGFTTGISQLEEILDPEILSQLQVDGIIEATRDSSIISFIIDNYDIANNQQAILDITNIGIVSYYDPEKDMVVLSGVETFLKYADAVGTKPYDLLLKYNTYGE